MEVTTIQKYLHNTPRKLRLVADLIRKMEPMHALDVLRVTPKYAAKDLAKALETVLANARQAGLDTANVDFKSIEVDEGMKMRRSRAGTRGRGKPYKKRMAHIRIVLTDEQSTNKTKALKASLSPKKEEAKIEVVEEKGKTISKKEGKK